MASLRGSIQPGGVCQAVPGPGLDARTQRTDSFHAAAVLTLHNSEGDLTLTL